MWTITVTAATLVAAVGSVELDKYRYHSTAVFLLCAVSHVPLRAESKFSTGTRQYYKIHPELKEGVKTGHFGMPVESRNRLADFLYLLRYW